MATVSPSAITPSVPYSAFQILNGSSFGSRPVRVDLVWLLSPSPSSKDVLGGMGSAAAMARPKTWTSTYSGLAMVTK